MRGPHCIEGCPSHRTSSTTTEEEKGEGIGTDRRMLLASFSNATHQLYHRRRKLAGRPSLTPHVGMDCTMLMLGQSQHLDSESGLNTSAFMCGWFVCMFVFLALMQNARGTPNHPVFHPVLFLPYSFFAISVICLSLSPSFSLSAIWLQ